MCGIAGYLDFATSATSSELIDIALRMAKTLYHRGPDDEGVWIDERHGVALSFRRLMIIDRSAGGHQPMLSRDERYVLVYNGEIYNYKELRQQLVDASVNFRSASDTEVLLEGIAFWGLEEALRRCNGMFAFALWDRQEKTLYLARDRMGKKPLYYARIGSYLIFASELKALCAHPGFQKNINHNALALYLRYSYVPDPYSIFQHTHKLAPGNLLSIPIDPDKSMKNKPYWNAEKMVSAAFNSPFLGSEAEAKAKLHDILMDSVRLRMIADVPLGAFLSGGIDSSTIVAFMQTLSDRPVKTFTIGFHEQGYNEADNAAQVARHLKTDHTELYLTPKEAMDVIPRLSTLYDEPFSDVSQIPTFLVAQLAKQEVTVVLSGDGGDELFGGYNRHRWIPLFWKHFGSLPAFLKKPILAAMMAVPPQYWDKFILMLGKFIPTLIKQKNVGDKVHKLARMLSRDSAEDMYIDLISNWEESPLRSPDLENSMMLEGQAIHFPDRTHKFMYVDMVRYLPGDILTKVDRASMGVSLEARAPFLDYRVVEFSWQLPLDLKIKNNRGKYLLRKILETYVPNHFINRPKMGFGVPVGQWLRGPLRDWVESLIHRNRLTTQCYLTLITSKLSGMNICQAIEIGNTTCGIC